RRYQQEERLQRPQVLGALVRRIIDMRQNDVGIGLRHAANWLQDRLASASIAETTRQVYALVRANYPAELAVRMTLKPLQLPSALQRVAVPPLAFIANSAILR